MWGVAVSGLLAILGAAAAWLTWLDIQPGPLLGGMLWLPSMIALRHLQIDSGAQPGVSIPAGISCLTQLQYLSLWARLLHLEGPTLPSSLISLCISRDEEAVMPQQVTSCSASNHMWPAAANDACSLVGTGAFSSLSGTSDACPRPCYQPSSYTTVLSR